MFDTLGDLVGTAGNALIDSAVYAIISPVQGEAQDSGATREPMSQADIDAMLRLDEWNAAEEAFAQAEGDEDAALDILIAEGIIAWGMSPAHDALYARIVRLFPHIDAITATSMTRNILAAGVERSPDCDSPDCVHGRCVEHTECFDCA